LAKTGLLTDSYLHGNRDFPWHQIRTRSGFVSVDPRIILICDGPR
jgi:hypothetical protein